MTDPVQAQSNSSFTKLWSTLNPRRFADAIDHANELYRDYPSEENLYRAMSSIFTCLNGPGRVFITVLGYRFTQQLWVGLSIYSLDAVQPLMAEYESMKSSGFANRAEAKAFHSRLEMLYAYLGMLWKRKDKFERTAQHEISIALDAVEPILTARARALITQLSLSESELMVMAREIRRLQDERSTLFILENLTNRLKGEISHTSATTHARLAVLVRDNLEMWRGVKRMSRMSPRPTLAILKALSNLIVNFLRS